MSVSLLSRDLLLLPQVVHMSSESLLLEIRVSWQDLWLPSIFSVCSPYHETTRDHDEPVLTWVIIAGFGSTSTFMPVIAEMKIPRTFPKALFISQGTLVACYMSFGMVVYM